jgi:hypothetical protein
MSVFLAQKRPALSYRSFHFSGRVGIRTPNLLIRSEMLYPIELRNHCPFGIAKVEFLWQNEKLSSKILQKLFPFEMRSPFLHKGRHAFCKVFTMT